MKTSMKKIFITLSLVIVLFAVGCVTTPVCVCPPENVVFPLYTPMGPIPLMMPKGFFTEEDTRDEWMTEEEFNKPMMEDGEQPQPQIEKDFDYKHEGQSVNKL